MLHGKHKPLTLLLFAALLGSCGEEESEISSSRSPVAAVDEDQYRPPAAAKTPGLVSPVVIGSKDTAAYPPPGDLGGTLFLRLMTEAEGKIYYSFRAFDESVPNSALIAYTTPLLLLPPVTVWVAAEFGNVRGPIRSYAYGLDPKAFPPIAVATAERMPPPSVALEPLALTTTTQTYAAVDVNPSTTTAPDIDGKATGWDGQGRTATTDALYDVPQDRPDLDVSYVQAAETVDALFVVIGTRGAPRTGALSTATYGFEVGPSNISFATFGAGTSYLIRAEVVNGKLALIDRAKDEAMPVSSASFAAIGDVIEIKVAKADLPSAFTGAGELALRAYAVEGIEGTTILDRAEPLFLRSRFTMTRATDAPRGAQNFSVDFLTDPGAEPDPGYVAENLALSHGLIGELEKINNIRFYNGGDLPLFFVAKDEQGYAGLNTTDRGVLTTIGPGGSAVARTQLLAHELAHYQNARNSQLLPRWLQEGMSDWTAERVLYRHFPPRVAHKFVRKLRIDRYFDVVGTALDTFPLDTWGTEVHDLGYEKSQMFMDVLETQIGTAVLTKAFQLAVNEPMDSAGFQSFLEKETGNDLTDLFTYWIFPGAAVAGLDPQTLFVDADGDDLMRIDEDRLGTDPAKADTDADGYPDGEEYYFGTNPLVSGLTAAQMDASVTAPALVVTDAADTSAWLRLGGPRDLTISYSLNPYATAGEQSYKLPEMLRPPYAVAAELKSGAASRGITILKRDLVVNGQPVNITFPPDFILPLVPKRNVLTPLATIEYASGVAFGATPLAPIDAAGDVPKAYAGLDVKGLTVTETEKAITIDIATAAPPSPYGEHGDFVIAFDSGDFTASQPKVRSVNALTLTAGARFWHRYDNDVETTGELDTGAVVTYGAGVHVELAKDRLATWLSASDERTVCVNTMIDVPGPSRLRERGPCATLANFGFQRRAARVPDKYGIAPHTVELYIDDASFTEDRAHRLLGLVATALPAFETVLGRPLLDRNYWPVHLTLVADGPTSGSATSRVGAYLKTDLNYEGPTLDYLLVEQLARLVAADHLDRSGDRPYWIQELYIQWLASSALYSFYASAPIHDFHAGRIADYICYKDGGCPNLYLSDVALADWSAETPSSTGSVKSLMFTLRLDALLGADLMGPVMTHFANHIPDSAAFKQMLKAVAPNQALAIETLWGDWVDQVGPDPRASVQDTDGDGMYFFEEQKLGTSDTIEGTYLDP